MTSRNLCFAAAILSIQFAQHANASTTKHNSKIRSSPIAKRRHYSDRRNLQLTTTANSTDDEIDSNKQSKRAKNEDSTSSISQTTKNGELICSPTEECELCPLKWEQLLDQDEENIMGEFESCAKWGRRQQFECTVMTQGELTASCILLFKLKNRYYLFATVNKPYFHLLTHRRLNNIYPLKNKMMRRKN